MKRLLDKIIYDYDEELIEYKGQDRDGDREEEEEENDDIDEGGVVVVVVVVGGGCNVEEADAEADHGAVVHDGRVVVGHA